jgi:hypothetical protein
MFRYVISSLGKCGDNLVIGDAGIGFPPSLRRGSRQDAPRPCTSRCHTTRGITERRKWHEPNKRAPGQFCEVSFRSVNYCVIYIINWGLPQVRHFPLLKPLLRFVCILCYQTFFCRSQWPRGLKHELSSPS